ncbi:hypothetical protein MHYP_G00322250 [Metynnis hypsauchen]
MIVPSRQGLLITVWESSCCFNTPSPQPLYLSAEECPGAVRSSVGVDGLLLLMSFVHHRSFSVIKLEQAMFLGSSAIESRSCHADSFTRPLVVSAIIAVFIALSCMGFRALEVPD